MGRAKGWGIWIQKKVVGNNFDPLLTKRVSVSWICCAWKVLVLDDAGSKSSVLKLACRDLCVNLAIIFCQRFSQSLACSGPLSVSTRDESGYASSANSCTLPLKNELWEATEAA